MLEPAALPAASPPALAPAPSRLVPVPDDRAAPDPAAGSAGHTATPTSPPAAEIEIADYDFAAALTLERELGVSHVLAQVLVRRGLGTPEQARDFLDPRDAYDPGEFAGMPEAVAMIRRHLASGTRIVVHGDYDVDGVCATATVVRALRALGADANWLLPSRMDDGYGLSPATIERLAAHGTRLLITVDCGITAVDEVAAARAAGIDVLITDHHAPRLDGRLPAAPILHPVVSGYPFTGLCGTGVAFKLAQALGASTAEEDVELVALATVADLMPLVGENRRLVREGLRALANTAKPGLRALCTVARVDPSALDAHALGFRLAPRINAAGRVSRADAPLELILTGDPERAREIATELDASNAQRRAIEQRIVWEAEAQVAALGPRSAYLLAAEGWHPGVIGIVASRIVERHHRPTILVALDGDGPAQGSGRSIPGFDLLGALHAAAGEMIRYGGHSAAAGLTIRPDRIAALAEAIEERAARLLTPEQLQPRERVDAIVSGGELGLRLAEELERLEPCGMGNPSPRLLVPGARFGELRAMGEDGRHARFSVRSGGGHARAVAFGCDGRLPGTPGAALDATFRLERNVWNGIVDPRLVLRHARPCAPGPIDVLGEPVDYLRAALAELDSPLADGGESGGAGAGRVVLERHGESVLAVLADALAAGEPVLAVCADVPRRLAGLSARTGGFALVSHQALERDPRMMRGFAHVVALDPPAGVASAGLLRRAPGFTHLAWGEAELRFAEQIHELEYGLRASLASLYRGLRERGRVAGGELGRLLRGDGPHGRPARLAGRLIRVLAELELVSLDRDLPGLAIAGSAPTALERSAAYRAYARRYEDGRRFLSTTTPRRNE